MTTVRFTSPTEAGAEVSRRTERHMAAHSGTSYQEALHVVLSADPELAKAYGAPALRAKSKAITPRRPPAAVKEPRGIPSGQTLHIRAEALVAEHPQLDYGEAVHRVLDADPALKTAYAGV